MRVAYAGLRQGLIGAWCPSLGHYGQILPDYSAYSRNAMVSVAAWSARSGRFAPLVTGGAEEVSCPSSAVNVSGNFTLAMWFYATAYNGTYCTLFDKGNAYECALFFNTSGNITYAGFGKTVSAAAKTLGIALNQWQHVAVARTGTAVTYYRNGAPTATDTISGTTTGSSALSMGNNFSGGGTKPLGLYDDIRSFTRALTGSEIAILASRPGIGLVPQRQRRAMLGGTQAYLNVGGTWKTATPWVNVGGVWKQAAPNVNVGGTWK